MKKGKATYFKDINIIRLLACLAVLTYHLGFLRGGYLAVCTFFVLSGYLGVISAFKKKDFSIKEYYINRFKKIYIPLLLVVFSTIAVSSFFKDVYWLSLKSETISVLFGYNNFWQISANLDYFARHVDSPFMHLWYIGILLQFDLLFPLIFKGLKNIGKKYSKKLPIIITFILSILSIIYFVISSNSSNLMVAYYNTFTRAFSLLLGLMLGFIHTYYGVFIFDTIKNKKLEKVVFYSYIIILILLFLFIKSTSNYFSISMIITTLISMRLIDYASISKEKEKRTDKLIKESASISYEIYLLQYPVIFLFQYININHYIKIPIMIIIILGGSYILNMATNRKKKKLKKIPAFCLLLLTSLSLYGGYKFITIKNFEKEMKALEIELAENEKIMLQKQAEYQKKEKKNEQDWVKELENLENDNNYDAMVKELNLTFVGDSVMLGAMTNIQKMFPNSYFDAKESRSTKVGVGIIEELIDNGKIGETVVIHLGTNGDCKNGCKEELMEKLSDKTVFWITTTYKNNYEQVNSSLESLVSKYPNAYLIDWHSESKDKEDWFYKDGIHLPPKGRTEYTNLIYNSLLNVYKDVFKNKKEQLIKEHQEELKNKIAFYGNDILFYNFSSLQANFSESKFNVKKEFSYKELKESIEASKLDNTLSNKLVFAFDNSTVITTKEYQELIELCSGSKIYLVSSGKPIDSLGNYQNVTVIDFYSEIKKHKEYLNVDGIHLTDKGNEALNNLLLSTLK